MSNDSNRESEVILYQTEDGQTRVEVQFKGDTAWLSLTQMAELFQRNKSVISRHIANIFKEGELQREANVANFATVQSEGVRGSRPTTLPISFSSGFVRLKGLMDGVTMST